MNDLRDIAELTIYEGEWLQGDEDSVLFRESDKRKCCLGQYAEVCGYPLNILKSLTSFSSMIKIFGLDIEQIPASMHWLFEDDKDGVLERVINSRLAQEMMVINDCLIGTIWISDPYGTAESILMTIEKKKELLIDRFAQVGIKATFAPGLRPR